jgi:hypothetical protein
MSKGNPIKEPAVTKAQQSTVEYLRCEILSHDGLGEWQRRFIGGSL